MKWGGGERNISIRISIFDTLHGGEKSNGMNNRNLGIEKNIFV